MAKDDPADTKADAPRKRATADKDQAEVPRRRPVPGRVLTRLEREALRARLQRKFHKAPAG